MDNQRNTTGIGNTRPDYIRTNESLARYSSWRIGGPAQYFTDVATPVQLIEALGWSKNQKLPIFILGGGSNILIHDSGFAGLVIRYRDLEVQIKEDGDTAYVRVGAGAPTAGTARKLTRQGWAGLEWAEGIPGTIGGAVSGNSGCYGGDIASSLSRAWLLVDNTIEEWPVDRFEYGYRTSVLKAHTCESPGPIVVAAEFKLVRTDPWKLAIRLAAISEERRSKTPSGQSCGSVFKNPPGDSAGRLIEATGLKETRIGGAEIAQKHANYIINRGGATYADALQLINLARERVLAEFGITLELEVQLVGGKS
ncbi:MAG: UDP-N-acetylmuramate dehydrogenase [Chloroflexi bacterium AL-W]|nr:UDP-N-acetylmuramate dehydrogenase [Chloroflexi bacterium AL-N1]NOK65184.1 UDP-N-acetylmuramate dehydrogenase [Chloroflexi bacterium AL-N10]NOK72550.1 UDP-N-acetylmuramate dehydrogenase [Chloroflexi bacterium AL-N5]NOK79363.1 UDP-N-acetylmuramate dehydrogenase [Chloroflexi bacterium AL-W]NOK87279.1 UDP-N-acetylmuramate dehydrogenase [Chloroflexi bacterium AL-N15]